MAYISYSQTTGEIAYHSKDRDFVIGIGWAGNGDGKNRPEYQSAKSTGPLPRGWYHIGAPENHPTVGPFALRLTPYPENEMFGRDGFLIHGAAKDPQKYGQESRGCIVAPRVVRTKIHDLAVTELEVTR